MSDYEVFYRIGQEFWQGRYSSLSLYPLPAMLIFALLALFPPWIGLGAIVIGSMIILIALFKWRAFLWLWYVPIIQVFALGQIDILMLGLWRLNTFWSLALLSLKPQLFLLAIPALLKDRVLLKRTALGVLLLYGVPTVFYPQWIGQWLQNIQADDRTVNASNAVLTVAPVIVFIVVAGLTLTQRWHWVTAATSFNPMIRSYDYTLLAGVTLWLIPLSWLAWLVEANLHQWWAMGMCGVVAGVVASRRAAGPQGANLFRGISRAARAGCSGGP